MFMMEKPLIILIFVYFLSFTVYAGQFLIGDVFHSTITNFQGVPIKSNLETILNMNNLQHFVTNVNATSANKQNVLCTFGGVACSVGVAAGVAWELLLLATGTYIFNFLFLMGVPTIIIIPMVIIYFILLARMILGYVRGI